MALYEKGKDFFTRVYSIWVVDEMKDIRLCYSVTNKHFTDMIEFFGSHVPKYATSKEERLLEKITRKSEDVKQELYYQLGRAFKAVNPEATGEINKRRQDAPAGLSRKHEYDDLRNPGLEIN